MKKRILFVDDDRALTRLVQKQLERAGYAVDVACGGRQGLAKYAEGSYDLLAVDQSMPGLEGLDMIRILASRGPLPPTIMVTGAGSERIAVEALKLGISDYVVKDAAGAFLDLLPAVIDRVLERQHLAQENKRMERELAQAQKLEAVGQLAAGIAHEINTPTQYVGDNTRFLQEAFADIDKLLGEFDRLLQAAKDDAVTDELVAEVEAAVRQTDLDYLTDETPKAIRQSLEGVQRVAGIVRAMKEFSHPGSDQKHPVDLNRAIQSTLTVSRNEWKYVADVVTDFDPDLPPVYCLPGFINQAILNVIMNAAQAIGNIAGNGAPGKGTITVRTRRDGDWVEIRISDTGTGIPEEIRPKVFDHFFTTKEVGKGTGQGLSIAYSVVVKKHGGTINFETEPGKGTTFIIRLPITDQSLKAES